MARARGTSRPNPAMGAMSSGRNVEGADRAEAGVIFAGGTKSGVSGSLLNEAAGEDGGAALANFKAARRLCRDVFKGARSMAGTAAVSAGALVGGIGTRGAGAESGWAVTGGKGAFTAGMRSAGAGDLGLDFVWGGGDHSNPACATGRAARKAALPRAAARIRRGVCFGAENFAAFVGATRTI